MIRARSSVGFHLLRSFQAPSRFVRLFFLLDFFLSAARLLASEGSQSPREPRDPTRLLGILPTLLPLEEEAEEDAAAADAESILEDGPAPEGRGPPAPRGPAPPERIGGAVLGVSGSCIPGIPEPSREVGLEVEGPAERGVLGAPAEDDDVEGRGPPAAAVAAEADGEVEVEAAAESPIAAADCPGGAMQEAVSTISSSNLFRLMARELLLFPPRSAPPAAPAPEPEAETAEEEEALLPAASAPDDDDPAAAAEPEAPPPSRPARRDCDRCRCMNSMGIWRGGAGREAGAEEGAEAEDAAGALSPFLLSPSPDSALSSLFPAPVSMGSTLWLGSLEAVAEGDEEEAAAVAAGADTPTFCAAEKINGLPPSS